MRRIARGVTAVLLVGGFAMSACGDDEVDQAARQADEAAERVKDGAGEAREEAEDALATFRTGFERLVDEASSGDAEAKEKLLDECRDSLEQLRKDNDPRAEQVGALCERIRNADDGNAWKEIREEYNQLKDGS
ncbi:MAG TPA: hypothetical protein VNB24_02775 [Acidimicrobiales bacterium]|nr:hypothetical protein [Acidimicrobiales bacterium]